MSLTDFFRINQPYGLARTNDGKWYAFNREYLPLGYVDEKTRVDPNNLPVGSHYKKFDRKLAEKLSGGESDSLHFDDKGEPNRIMLYLDRTNPLLSDSNWNKYVEKLKLLSKLEVDFHVIKKS